MTLVPPVEPAAAPDWTGARIQRVEPGPATTIFAQGDPATNVMYAEHGVVRLSVLSHTGKEAVVVVLDAGGFIDYNGGLKINNSLLSVVLRN